ncbi:WD40 repeat-like protein [Cucurbitaria berberidis CBS 394.84]|uniref:WD40 repeat-like protein n=1 Tax=Cucurbitaria berberidis CBS 394.84 TaxID=1168544 RepID=A0A9P4G905_9PLEO|nr:WD40 repeat-like protein [Cucurbitaria berberidis CBS 394.84]KAF1841184.1 WD40 repeat-like protein [Cucurbitaria berberidis CBS 394.84]
MNSSGLSARCLASTTLAGGERQDDVEEKQDSKKDYSPSGQYEEALLEENRDEIIQGSPWSPDSSSPSDSGTDVSSDRASSEDRVLDHQVPYTSCIQEAQLSPDGTCIFSSDYSRTFSVYPIETDILSETKTRPLKPYAQFNSANPIWAFAANPHFNLQDANSTHVLISRRDSYITLHNALWDTTRNYDTATLQPSKPGPVDISKPLASYKLIDHLTEAVTAPLSLAYSHEGTHFFAGKQNGIATFDLEHTEDPIHSIATIPSKRNKLKGGGRGFKGWISALSLSPPSTASHGGLLAAGARTRYVGIYDATSGEEVTHFSLPGTIDGKKVRNENLRHIMGDGVSHLKWSPCGKYLYVAERQSDVLLIYDVRNFSLSPGYCAGRKALTKQKLGFDVWNAGASPYDIEAISHEIWAGGTDGKMRVWRDPYRKEGPVEADEVVQVGGEDMPVVSTLVHSSGSLAVAACGRIEIGEESTSQRPRRGGGLRPRFREWGSLNILGLG